MNSVLTLGLVHERKIGELLSSNGSKVRWEASGILVQDGSCFVVFDDRTEVARLSTDLAPDPANGLFGMADDVPGYEGITFNPVKQRYYLLVEARQSADDRYNAVIVEYDAAFSHVKSRIVDFPFRSDNKGFEAVAYMRRGDDDFLLALCEGNRCKCGKKGREPGGGRVQVFEKKRKTWRHLGTIKLPGTIPFVDYSGMSVHEGRVAVVSQVNSML